MKSCTGCHIDKSLDEYYTDKRSGKPHAHCKTCHKAYGAKNYLQHRDTRLKKGAFTYREIREKAIEYRGGMCERCGFNDRRALQFDHIEGGGSQERKSVSGRTILHRVLNDDPRYQLLCANCNWIKRAERNENRPKMF